jgi:hypothetical protein
VKKSWMTKLSLWYLRNYEYIVCFVTGGSWVFAITWLFVGACKHWPISTTVYVIFCSGVITLTAVVLFVKAASKYLLTLEGEAKEEAHAEMTKIIFRRIGH